MKEIKFRAYDTVNKKLWKYAWVTPEKINCSDYTNGCWNSYLNKENVILMQYIGKKDKYEVNIYEDDKILCTDKNELKFNGRVIYNNCSFVIQHKSHMYYNWDDYDIEVIGNRYEKKE